jgi:hypothetical protein
MRTLTIITPKPLKNAQIKYTYFLYKMEKPKIKLPISATKEFLNQYDRASSYYYPYKVSQVELDKLREIYERYQGYASYEGGIDKKELMRDRHHHLHLFLLDHMPDIYKDINSSLYGGRKHKRSSKKSRSSKRKPSLVEVDINTVLNCKNKKYGCDLRAKQYTCYKRMRCKTNKSSPDTITLTNRRNKTKKIRPVIRVENVWYDCSHFTK